MRSRAILLITVLMVACGSEGATEPNPGGGDVATVDAVGATSWNPSPVSIAAGESVQFRNTTNITHNITFEPATAGRPADVANFSSGSRSVTFATAGTFDYHCGIHPVMQGRVVVLP